MHFGLHIEPTERTMDLRDLGRLLEERGFESLWLPEHTHLPVRGASVHPSGPQVHDRLRRLLDPLIGLTAVAAVTDRLLLGTGVCLVPEHDPIVLAKQVATLDALSGGRVLFGVGAGWNREELRNHGVDPATRWRVLRERVLAMKRIWTEDEAEFHGEFVDFEPIWLWPKPARRPHPPVLVGGEGPRVLDRVLDYGDEWAPNDEPGIVERIPELRRRAAARGCEPVPVTLMHVVPDVDLLRRYEAAGVARCVFSLPGGDAAEVRPAVERPACYDRRAHRRMGASRDGKGGGRPMGMLLSYSTWGMPKVPIDVAVAHCARLGYDGLELTVIPRWITDAANLDVAERRRIRALYDDHGLDLCGLAGNTPLLAGDADEQAANLARFRGYLDLAAELQHPGERLTVTTTSAGDPEDWEAVKHRLVDRFGELAAYAERQGVVVGAEPHVNTALHLPEQAIWLVEQVNSPALTIHFDISHFNVQGLDMEEVVAQVAPHSVHTHVKDERGIVPDFEFLIPGEGDCDYVRYLKAMDRAGYTGHIVVEISVMVQRRPDYDPLAAAEQSYRVLARAFEDAGIERTKG